MRALDWSTSPLGPPESWPQSLRSVVGLLLGSKFPMFLAWGEELGFLYNDPYAEILGAKHPRALGQRFRDIWAEIWPDISPLIDVAMAGEATYHRDLPLVMNRRGFDEQTWFTFSYSPMRDSSGRVAGMFCACIETTDAVLAGRRQAFRLALEERLRGLREPDAIMTAAVTALGEQLGADRVGYGQVLADDATVRLSHCYADGVEPLLGDFPLDGFGPEMIARQRRGEVVVCEDVFTGPDQNSDTWRGIDTRAFVSVPLIRDGRFRASLYVNARAPRRWSPEEVALAEEVAARTWEAVERARSEAELRESEARKLAALRIARLGTLEWRPAEGAVTLDERSREILGFGVDEGGTADELFDRIHPDDLPRIRAEALAGAAAGEPLALDYRIVLPDGGTRNLATECAPVGGETGRMTGVIKDVTERVINEVRVRESERELSILTDALPVLISYVDKDERYRFNNKAYEDWFGRSREELRGREVREVVGEAAYEHLKPQVERALSGERFMTEQLVQYKDGGARHVRVDYLPRIAADGEVEGYYALVQDISDRKAAEAATVESEARFRNMADNAPMMMWVTDAEGYCTYLNRAWYEFTGQTSDEAEGLGWLDATHPADKAEAERVFLEANAAHASFRLEYRLRRADGAYRWAIDAASPRFSEDGGFLGYVGSVIDIDELKEAEAALERRVAEALAERKVLADIVEGTDALVQVADLDFRWLAVNKAAADEFERIYGVRPKVGDSMLELLADQPEHQAAVEAVWSRALAGEAFTEVAEFGDPERNRRFYEMKHNLLRDAWGAQVGAYQFAYEVTDRMREQRRLTEAEEALRQSQKMEAIGQLTGGVAHDFNNLLTPIVGSLDLLQRRGIGSEREQCLIGGALQSAERAKTLVQRLLAFARRQPLQPVAVDLAALVSGMAGLIGSTVGPKIDVRVELADDLPPARADPNQLEMAILNLGVNARDAMPDGGTLTIAAKPESMRPGQSSSLSPGQYVRLSVSDTGTGMDETTLARAVEPFFSTKGVGKGTGLGLSMVHGLTAQLGGGLTIASAPDRGTTVDLWLPVSAGPVAEVDAPAVQPIKRRLGQALLVDDEELVRMSTADMLADFGYEVVEANSAEEALRLLETGMKPDILVTDHLMPGMSGAELAREVRAASPAVPILIVSGYAEVEGIAPDLPRLAKPFRSGELAERLAELGAPDAMTAQQVR